MIEMTKEELTQATKDYGKMHIAHRTSYGECVTGLV